MTLPYRSTGGHPSPSLVRVGVLTTACALALTVAVPPPAARATPGDVTTVAGSDGSLLPGPLPSPSEPAGVAIDTAGNVFVVDRFHRRILKVSPVGVLSVFAGSGVAGSADGPGASASFNSPFGLAIDTSGNLYVGDTANNKIRKVTAGGVVSTLAGTGAAGSIDGASGSATFNSPRGVTVDVGGTVYVADAGNNKIRAVTTGGIVTTLAGTGAAGSADGPGASATFNSPAAVTVDGSKTVFVADRANNKVRRITNSGIVTTLAGTGAAGSADGSAASATFSNPIGVAVNDKGDVFVVDSSNFKIRIISSGTVGTYSGAAGGPFNVDGPVSVATFDQPQGITISNSGTIFITGSHIPAVRKIVSGVVSTIAPFSLRSPWGVTADLSGILISDTNRHRIQRLSTSGTLSTLAGDGVAGYVNGTTVLARFNGPSGIGVNSTGDVFVADTNNHVIRKISSTYVVSTFAGSGSIGSADGTGTGASFNYPSGLVVDGSGNVYVGDSSNNKVRKITPGGVVTTLAGTGAVGAIDGPAGVATFSFPRGLTLDSTGNLYVADYNNHKIRKINPAGVVSTLAGSGTPALVNGVGSAASFKNPSWVSVDASANVYVGDTLNNVIRKITAGGVVSTLAGSSAAGSADGPAASAQFYLPAGVVVVGSGLFVADSYYGIIRRVALT